MQILPLLIALVALLQVTPSKQIRIPSKKLKRAAGDVESCDSKVYCQGTLLDTIQRARLVRDSKTFVDMSQNNPESVTLKKFNELMSSTNNKPSKDQIQKFVDDNFNLDLELQDWKPKDHKENPAFLYRIRDSSIQTFAKNLVAMWPLLGRRVRNEVKRAPTQHSIIPVPEGFIVPGGRFRELYYWDSYWIIKGLLLSEMSETVVGMLNNFIYMIKMYGLIPNGSRVYYINRSQPPFFTLMVGLYLEYTADFDWLKDNVQHIEKELNFWLNKRVATISKGGQNYRLAYYGPESNTPRPESYGEDVDTCNFFQSDAEKKKCYNSLKTGAETGWDFSTRWFFDANGGTNANLSSIDSSRVFPVDLNALLCKSFRLLSQFYQKLGNDAKRIVWEEHAETWQSTIEQFLYNKEDGIWYDYDRTLNKQRKFFFPSNFAPLWADCYNKDDQNEYGQKAADYVHAQGIGTYLGGVPTSLENSGEQWDMPNAWPPLQDFVVFGLYNTGNKKAQALAEKLAFRWINANMKGFASSGSMYEKYDAIDAGKYGGGGEYEVQFGFGWSNGVVLHFIDTFASSSIPKPLLNSLYYTVVFTLLAGFRAMFIM